MALIGERPLTDRELNRRANQLAHRLRARGVRPDVLVGICVERSVEMIAQTGLPSQIRRVTGSLPASIR